MGSRKIYFPNIQFFFMILIAKKIRKGNCMMNTIVNENLISFKELEQKIFNKVCYMAHYFNCMYYAADE